MDVLRQIETTADQGISFRTCIAEKNTDLTVLDPSGRAAVLTRNPDRMSARLEESRLIQNQHAGWIAKMLDHIIPADVSSLLLIPYRPEAPASAMAPGRPRIPPIANYSCAQRRRSALREGDRLGGVALHVETIHPHELSTPSVLQTTAMMHPTNLKPPSASPHRFTETM